jgi:hypothetical protein
MPERPPEAGHRAPYGNPPPGVDDLTRAELRAQSRCEPLTPAEFKLRRRAAETGLVSLRELLDESAAPPAVPPGRRWPLLRSGPGPSERGWRGR